jgi:DNA invertase Pin-like site-specific DNA recombinase
LDDCRTMAEREGWTIAGEFKDEAFSAWSGDRGPGLAAAREKAAKLAEQGRCVLLCQHSDRLARGDGRKAQHLGELYFWATKANVEFRSVQDDSTFTNPLLAFAMGERNEQDSARKSLSVRAGKARRKAKGLFQGRPPLGYQHVDDKLMVIEEEARVVQRIFREFLSGVAQHAIAKALDREQVKTKHGGAWHQATIRGVLSNRYVLGELPVEDGWMANTHEPIIDRDTWERAQRLLETTGRAGRGRRTATHTIFRKGYLQCGACGESMIARSGRSPSYLCMSNHRRGAGTCPMPIDRATLIDDAVLSYFENVWLDVDATTAKLKASFTAWSEDAAGHRAEAEREAHRARERFARVRRDYQDEKITVEDWSEQRGQLQEELQAAEAQVEAMRHHEAQVAEQTVRRDVEAETLRTLASMHEAKNLDHVRAVLQCTFQRFVLEIDPKAAKRIERFPDARTRSLSLVAHGGLSITPHLREDVVERTGADSFSVEKVALPGPNNYCASQNAHLWSAATPVVVTGVGGTSD